MPDVRHALTRRRLLRAGLVVGGVGVVAASGGAFVFWPRAAAAGRAVLSTLEVDIVDALADAYFPPGNAFGYAAADVDVAGGVDGYLASLPLRQARLIRGLLVAVDQWPRLSLSSTSAFRSLARDARVDVLRAFESSSLGERRQLAGLLRLLVAVPFLDDPRLRADNVDWQWGCPVLS